MIKVKKQVMYSKLEATYGVDPVPLGATDAVVANNVRISPVEVTAIARPGVASFFGGAGKIIAGEHVKFGFDVEMFTSGVAGTPAAYAALMKGAAHAETIVALTSVTNTPITSGEQSMTHYFNRDGKLRKITGWKGSIKAKMSPKGIPMWSFDGVGLYLPATDVVLGAATLTTWKSPLAVGAGTTVATLFGFAALVSEFSFDQGSKVVYRELINGESVQIIDRASTASIVIEEPSIAAKDFELLFRMGTLGALSITHGTVAGSKLQHSAAQVQIVSLAETVVDDIAHLTLGLEYIPSADGNDYSWAFL